MKHTIEFKFDIGDLVSFAGNRYRGTVTEITVDVTRQVIYEIDPETLTATHYLRADELTLAEVGE